MRHLIDLPLEEGGSITVEVDDAPASRQGGPVTRSARPGELATAATKTFEEALGDVAPASRAIVSKLRAAADPSEIVVEFGLKVSVESGVIVAHTGGEANFRVMLTWGNR